jgi:hypothetical protein
MLDEELGIDPPTGLKELERRMLRRDPLDAPGGAPSPGPPRPRMVPPRRLAAGVERPAGRERELAHLERLLGEAHAGERRLVFVTERPGSARRPLSGAF